MTTSSITAGDFIEKISLFTLVLTENSPMSENAASTPPLELLLPSSLSNIDAERVYTGGVDHI